jgi:hypothetical protein
MSIMGQCFATPPTSSIAAERPKAPLRPKRTMPLPINALTLPISVCSMTTHDDVLNSSEESRESSFDISSPPVHKKRRGWSLIGNTEPTPMPPVHVSSQKDRKDGDHVLCAFRQQLAIDVQIVDVPSHNPSIDIADIFSNSMSTDMRAFATMIAEGRKSPDALQLIDECTLEEQIYTLSTLYAVLAVMSKDEIAARFADKNSNSYWVRHGIGFWEIAMATTFQVTYRAQDMHEEFRRNCRPKDMDYVGGTKLFLCNSVLTTSVVGLIYSVHVDHLLWGGVYPAAHIVTVVDAFNLMAAHCTRDFSSSSKVRTVSHCHTSVGIITN